MAVVNKFPGSYIQGSKENGPYVHHQDYCERSDIIVEGLSTEISDVVDNRGDLQAFFLDHLPKLGQFRREIAIDHKVDNAYAFGLLRWDDAQEKYIRPITVLSDQYSAYSEKMKESLSKYMEGMFSITKVEEAFRQQDFDSKLGFHSRFKVNIYDAEGCNGIISELRTADEIFAKIENSNETDAEMLQEIDEIRQNSDSDGNSKNKKEALLASRNLSRAYKKEFPKAFQAESQAAAMLHVHNKYPRPIIKNIVPGLDVEHYLKSGYNYIPMKNSNLLVKGELGNLKSSVCLATSRLSLGGKLYGLSEYFFWTHITYEDNPLDWMVEQKRPITVIHHDSFLLEKTIHFVAEFFEKAVLITDEEETKESCALFRYTFAHLMPYSRGSAAIAEWFERAIYLSKGFNLSYNIHKQVDLEALTALTLDEFMDRYDEMIILKKPEDS